MCMGWWVLKTFYASAYAQHKYYSPLATGSMLTYLTNYISKLSWENKLSFYEHIKTSLQLLRPKQDKDYTAFTLGSYVM